MFFPRQSLLVGALLGSLALSGTLSAYANESAAFSPAERTWTGSHGAISGPTLDKEWFADRQAIVYLLPKGVNFSSVRKAASQMMQEEWLAGKHGIKHIFISNAKSRIKFAAQQRIAYHEITEQVTLQAGQELEYAHENVPFVRDQVFFVWDPDSSAWNELLDESQSDDLSLAILLVDRGGHVVEVIDPDELNPEAELGELPEFVSEVRDTFSATP